MKVLWLCNTMLPRIAEALGEKAGNKEGWLTGLSEQLLAHADDNHINLGVCFPVNKNDGDVRGETGGLSYFGFWEDTANPEHYDEGLEARLAKILEEFAPDIVHVFGTEYPHTLAMTRCIKEKGRLLIGIQGICSRIAEAYMADLPEKVQKRYLLRDFLKRDNIIRQQQKFAKRGQHEMEALQNALHITGRTKWDREFVEEINPKAVYHFMNETLRPEFYGPAWDMADCEKYSIFVSQGNYPLKGLHYLLCAMPEILTAYPQAKVYVAGDVITRYNTLKEKLKIGSYGKYCLDLIKKNNLIEKVIFLGKLDSGEMCRQYLKSHVFLSPHALENSPNSVGEAMLLGMPVVSSDAGGVSSMITDKEEGLLYPCHDTKKLAEAVCAMFGDDGVAVEYGRRAKERAHITHAPRANYERLLEIYNEMTEDLQV